MITNMARVKMFAEPEIRVELGAPTTADAGALGDIWLDNDENSATFGKTWELVDLVTVPAPSYTWKAYDKLDARIERFLSRVERDFLAIRGIPFETNDDGTVYPDYANDIAAEMVCYAAGLGAYEGRGMDSENVADRSRSYERKINGYPRSIVGSIERFQGIA